MRGEHVLFFHLQKEPREPIFLYEPGSAVFDTPPPGEYPVPRSRGGPSYGGSPFRGGRDRDGGRQVSFHVSVRGGEYT